MKGGTRDGDLGTRMWRGLMGGPEEELELGLGVGAKRGKASQLHFEMFFKLKYVCKFWCGPNALITTRE